MVKGSYQKEAWIRNRNTIIKLLSDKPLTFKQLLTETGLSRSVLNEHLKALVEKGVVKKIYEKGKILNVLQPEKLDLAAWFLNQLSEYNIPEAVLDKGKKIINSELVVWAAVAYGCVYKNILTYFAVEKEPNEKQADEKQAVFKFKPLMVKREIPNVIEEEGNLVRDLIRDFHPLALTAVLTQYVREKGSFESASKDELNRWLQTEALIYPHLPLKVRTQFDKVSEWWFNEVVEYLPSSRFIQLLAIIYMNALGEKLQFRK